jgi:CheY-like chemotaxis protein
MERAGTYTILLIEADTTLRRMIALGLQHRGLHVVEASSPSHLPTMTSQPLDLVVLDIDGEAGNDHELLVEVQSHSLLSSTPIVALAWETSMLVNAQNNSPADHLDRQTSLTSLTCLTKPFDARTLHATIEQILLTTQEATSAHKQEAYLKAYSSTPTPSICPLIAAVGLLLVFTGLLLQFIITAVGLLIVVVALLWWTLGTKPASKPLAIEAN